MEFALAEEHRMLKDLVERFVADELMPLESKIIQRYAEGKPPTFTEDEHAHLDKVAKELGLYGLDAPKDVGGYDLPMVAMVGVEEALGRTVAQYNLPPDSANLRMLMQTVTDKQREAYLAPYVAGKTRAAMGISEPGAGSDPAGMSTRAVRDGDDWVLNGRKIWISNAKDADFTIVMAVTDPEKRARGGMSAFLVDKDTPGYNVLRKIPMVGGHFTYEVALEDCRVPGWKLLGKEGYGFAPMQTRLGTRRIQVAAWACGMAQRVLDMMIEYAPQRKTFGAPLSERQAIQWWIAEGATKVHATRMMTYHCAWKIDHGIDARNEISMIKWYGAEMVYEVIDRGMQMFGAMGMSLDLPLALMSQKARIMRIYDGATEIHKWVIARNLLGTRK
jgi:acyl-CoA dehydrogenase